MDIALKILATLGLVALNGYFVAAEFAAVGARLSRLEEMAEKGGLLSRLSLGIKRKLDLYLSTCQLGITMASLGLGYVTEPAVAGVIDPVLRYLGLARVEEAGHHSAIAITIALAISTALHVVVGEVAPKNWAILHPDKLLPLLAGPLVAFTYVFYPVIWLLNSASNAILRLTGVDIGHTGHGEVPHTEGELRALLAQAVQSGTIAQGNERLLTSAFEFGQIKTRQIMTPRTEVDYLVLGQPIGQVLRTVQKTAFTRLPLCDGDIDHVVGLVHMKDLFTHLKLVPGKLRFTDESVPGGEVVAIADGKPGSQVHVIGSGEIDLNEVRRDILFVPDMLPVPKLLRQFQTSHTHMAIVVDEYGSTQGLVTLEDVLEQLVGEIEDEFDADTPAEFIRDGENFRVAGRYGLHALKDRLELGDTIDGEPDVDSVGGWVIKQLGRFPKVGDTVPLGNYTVRVLSIQGKRVGRVLISPTTQTTARADGPGQA